MKKIYTALTAMFFASAAFTQATTLTETFDNVTSNTTTPVPGWTAVNNSNPVGTTGWFATTAFPGYIGGFIAANFNNTGSVGDISNWLISPVLELQNGRVIRFWSRAGTQTYPDRLEVRLSTNGASTNVGSTSTDVGDFTTVLLTINPSLTANTYPTTWTLYTATISGLSGTVSGRVAFRYYVTNGGSTGANSNIIGIDEFSYNVTPPAAPTSCGTPTYPASGATGVQSPKTMISWTAVSGATAYDLYFGTTSTPALVGNVAVNKAYLNSLSPNTTYYWYVVPKNTGGSATGCSSTVYTFTTGASAAIPANDECTGAVALSGYGSVGGSSQSATQSMTADATCMGTSNDDVWYKFTTVQAGSVNITVTPTNNTGFDAVIVGYSGNCGALTRISCVDNNGTDVPETLTLTSLNAATTYYVRVYDYNGAGHEGTFNISASGTALPVTIVEFRGQVASPFNVLSWTTNTEVNNAGFAIERSADGKKYSTIATMNSAAAGGNSTSSLNYRFVDEKPLGGSNYYRLKQTDLDGKVNYSTVVLLKNKVDVLSITAIYPNPAKDQINLQIVSPTSERITLSITDMSGRVIQQQHIQLNKGENQMQFNLRSMSPGTYLLKGITDDGTNTTVQRFVIN